MKAVDTSLLNFLKVASQFVVPIFQRLYSWEVPECRRLLDDVLFAGSNDLGTHFTGSIVYVARGEGTLSAQEPDLIIDGQQRLTTVTLLLAALAAELEERGDGEPVQGFSAPKIRRRYLINDLEDGDGYYKLLLTKNDDAALRSVISGAVDPTVDSRVIVNYRWFREQLAELEDLVPVCKGITKLEIVDVRLTRGQDNPQLVFETMNSTGKKLSQADLIRNFVLMDLPPREQQQLYELHWYPMERLFPEGEEHRFDQFVRAFLTMRTGSVARFDVVYDAFKAFALQRLAGGQTREAIVRELAASARRFAKLAFGGREPDPQLASRFREIWSIRADVVYPYLLRLYQDFDEGRLSQPDFLALLDLVINYLVRRMICSVPTNSLTKTFASLASAQPWASDPEALGARFLLFGASTRFPTDSEFLDSLRTGKMYGARRGSYLLRKLENYRCKELVSTAEYTIEHIMPQNIEHSAEWQAALGPDWREPHAEWLHTLGNLTLTGYNPEYSNRPFLEKRDMKGGFAESPLRLNRGLGNLETWNIEEIKKRAETLAQQALEMWPRPSMTPEELAPWQTKFQSRSASDWTPVHDILAKIPAGAWTGYYYLAEAVGLPFQSISTHLASRCPHCVNVHRVLTWDGKIGSSFAWPDPDDQRDPREVLQGEGVRFEGAFADLEQRLEAEELLALVEPDANLEVAAEPSQPDLGAVVADW